MAKRTLSLLLAALMLLGALPMAYAEGEPEEPVAAEGSVPAEPEEEALTAEDEVQTKDDIGIVASGSCGPNLHWELTLGGMLIISGQGGMTNYSSFGSAPWSGYRRQVATINIEDGVTSIGEGAFYGLSKMTAVRIPDTVTSIGECAFYNCTNLDKVWIPKNLTVINFRTFYGCSNLSAVEMSDSVTMIGNHAFEGCGNLSEITIPDKVSFIGQEAFYQCHSLREIVLPESVQEVARGAFEQCAFLTRVTVQNPQCEFWSVVAQYTLGTPGITTLYGYSDSTTEEFAAEYGYDFVSLGEKTLAAPALSKVANTTTGVRLTWKTVAGAVKYRVYYKTGSDGWTKIKDVTGTSYTWTGAKVNKKYSFTVRAIDKKGKAGAYDKTGLSITHYKLKTPAVPKASNAATGVKISWSKVSGAAKYRIFYKAGSGGWKKIGDTTKTSYTWTKAKSGTKYSFTIRCVTKDGKSYTSDYNTKGSQAITYIAAPKISKVSNTSTGVKVTWGKVTGAEKYRLYYKTGSGSWKKIADTTKTSYTWTKAKSGTKYSFTVRCVSADGKTSVSGYDNTGKAITYVAMPRVSKVVSGSTGMKITWGKVAGAAKYRVFYKIGNGKWMKLTDTAKTSYTWKKAEAGTTYSFTVRCVDKAGKSYTSAYDTKGLSIIA